MSFLAQFVCIVCAKKYDYLILRYSCDCGGLLDLFHDRAALPSLPERAELRLQSRATIDRSGVWRFREAVVPLRDEDIISQSEGATSIHKSAAISRWLGHNLVSIKHEGENPSGSFKDRGMTVAVSMAKKLNMPLVACASTGNTSSSLASYAARAGLKAVVFLPAGKVSQGKMAQTLGYGAKVLAIRGDFDDAMQLVQQQAAVGRVYMVNSLNPFRIEGQKTIMWELFQDRNWQVPDWIVLPGGNLGNTSAFGKAIEEAFQWGWIKKKPRLAVIQAEGASPFYQSFQKNFSSLVAMQAETIATAIRIGNPVNFPKAVRSMRDCSGLVASVSDLEIMQAKVVIDQAGIGCEPASAASLAGARKLLRQGSIKADEDVVIILTGHILKDPEAILQSTQVDSVEVEAEHRAISKALDSL